MPKSLFFSAIPKYLLEIKFSFSLHSIDILNSGMGRELHFDLLRSRPSPHIFKKLFAPLPLTCKNFSRSAPALLLKISKTGNN